VKKVETVSDRQRQRSGKKMLREREKRKEQDTILSIYHEMKQFHEAEFKPSWLPSGLRLSFSLSRELYNGSIDSWWKLLFH
jgi:hypothetical protein